MTGILAAPYGFAGNQQEEALADSVRLVDERTPTATFTPLSPLDTTDASGNAGRRVYVYLRTTAGVRDTVVVRAIFAYPAVYRNPALAADTVRIVIPVVPRPRS